FSYPTVFLAKLLKRLYGETLSSSLVRTSNREEESVPGNLRSKSEEKNLDNVQTASADASTSTDPPCKSFQGSDDTIMSPRRIYTVDLPPEGYVAVTPDAISNAVSEDSGSSADSTEEEYQGQTKRKRIRGKKQKSSLQISFHANNLHRKETESGMQETLVQDNLQLQQSDSPKISKNKKRKMKKKRQKEKKRAAGLVTKTTSVDFTYQPDKNNREEAAGLKDIDEKADSILDFLQATQQIYFADKKKECTDAAVNSATAQELLQYLESRTISSSDVTHLHRLKSLVLLQDIERLKDALKQFQEQSMMLP
ncbi:ERIC1 protein, partial [Campylorhamphus procurvoides]|nr:ERIC1 protein [Campylorhamphus procurvoides]